MYLCILNDNISALTCHCVETQTQLVDRKLGSVQCAKQFRFFNAQSVKCCKTE